MVQTGDKHLSSCGIEAPPLASQPSTRQPTSLFPETPDIFEKWLILIEMGCTIDLFIALIVNYRVHFQILRILFDENISTSLLQFLLNYS